MRLIATAALILASLVFSVGGVAIVGRADSTAPVKPADSVALPGQCPTPMPAQNVRIPSASVHAKDEVIVLNTHGYNYALPGEEQMDPTGRTQPRPATPAPAPNR